MYDEQEDAAQLEWCRQWSEEHKKKMTRKMQKKIRRVQHWCNCKLCFINVVVIRLLYK